MTDDLTDPLVPADVYDDDYYRSGCLGSEEWSASDGKQVNPIYAHILERADFHEGETVVDVGTGRGELVAVAIRRGARRAIGVDYSQAAIELGSQTLQAQGIDARGEVRLADARRLPIDDASVDLVTMVDVVEHLSVEELNRTYGEILRVLRPGGRLAIHTMPNRLIYDVTYRVLRQVARLGGGRWPADPRNDFERTMHVNEQTRGGMKRALLRAGFSDVDVDYGRWVHDLHVPDGLARRVYRRLAAHGLTRPLGSADLFALARRAPASR